jgi:hypothetical protein
MLRSRLQRQNDPYTALYLFSLCFNAISFFLLLFSTFFLNKNTTSNTRPKPKFTFKTFFLLFFYIDQYILNITKLFL